MRIKMKTLAVGPTGVFEAGQIYASPDQLSDEQALAFVDSQCADVVPTPGMKLAPALIETALHAAPVMEQAVKPRARKSTK